MEKDQKIIDMNNQEGEDLEVYKLYPENAITDTQPEKHIKKNNPNFSIRQPVSDKPMPFTNPVMTIIRDDD